MIGACIVSAGCWTLLGVHRYVNSLRLQGRAARQNSGDGTGGTGAGCWAPAWPQRQAARPAKKCAQLRRARIKSPSLDQLDTLLRLSFITPIIHLV